MRIHRVLISKILPQYNTSILTCHFIPGLRYLNENTVMIFKDQTSCDSVRFPASVAMVIHAGTGQMSGSHLFTFLGLK